jgi:hypothetical protein
VSGRPDRRGRGSLDAVAVTVNGVPVADPSDVNEIAQAASMLSVNYVFLQAKSSETWNGGEVPKLTSLPRRLVLDYVSIQGPQCSPRG